MSKTNPLVTVGLPVFNGEKYLNGALESLLGQEYENLEIVISDNASTDRTPEILEEWKKRDDRIRLYRNGQNLGGAANFNRVLELARGEYFRWAGHDDLLDPRMIGFCVETLETNGPSYILAFPDTVEIDAAGEEIETPRLRLELHQTSALARYRQVVRYVGKAHVIFGLMRRDAVQSTGGLGRFASADLVLIGKLALRGKFIRVPESLFYRRIHKEASWHKVGKFEGFTEWFDPSKTKKIVYPSWRLWGGFVQAPLTAPLPVHERVACSAAAFFDWARRRRRRLVGELVRTVPVIAGRLRSTDR